MITISTEMDLGNLVCGRCTVATDYSIALADDKVYHFFGDNSIHQINMLVYEDDRKSFEDLFSDTDNNEPVVVRLMRYDGRYRWCLIFVVQKNPIADREQYTQIEIRDIIALNKYGMRVSPTMVETYNLPWDVVMQRSGSTTVSSFSMLILNSPLSGDVRTFIDNTTIVGDLLIKNLITQANLSNSLTVCLSYNGMLTSNRSSVVVNAGASSSNDIETFGDNSGC